MKKYKTIVIDPPWPVKKTGKRKSRPNQGRDLDYETMTVDDICELPIREIADDNCWLFLWTTHGFLHDAFRVMGSYRFQYQRTLTWDKGNGMCLFGFHHRTEFVLVGYRGKVEAFPKRKAIPTVFSGKSPRHSQKPQEFYDFLDVLDGPKVDIFARQEREGWDVFGNEVDNSITLHNAEDSNGEAVRPKS